MRTVLTATLLLLPFLVGCRETTPKFGTVKDIGAMTESHKQWLAAGGCQPGADGKIDREDPAVIAGSIGNLEPTTFFRADLRHADLSNKDLRCVSFIGADLTGANLFGADLRGAFFNRATLADANMERADMRGTILHNANVERMVYQPRHPPALSSLALSKNLNAIAYRDDPTLLYAAKTTLKELGYLDAHKSLIAALRRSHPPEDTQAPYLNIARAEMARILQKVLFDWTSEFGSNAFRPLVAVGLLWLLCGTLYGTAILRETKAGISIVSTGERIPKGNRTPHIIRIRPTPARRIQRVHFAMSAGLFFSFWRTFHFGFKELDFGNWLRLVQAREFDIRAYGWPRVVSGIQSIASTYLLALSILSAFSTPFDM